MGCCSMTDHAAQHSGIGVVAIGRNEGERLIRALDALVPLGVPIVYVDSASTDASVAEAERRGAEVVHMDMSRPFTAGRARNEGVARLVERWPTLTHVQFVDGDCELDAQWLDTARAFLDAHLDVAVVCGRRAERFPEASVFNRLIDREWDTPVGEAAACGGDSLMRLDAFHGVGGFGTVIAGEEPELCGRLRAAGWRVWRLDAPMTKHDAALTSVRQWWLRGVRSGFGYAQVWDTTRAMPDPLYRRETQRALAWAVALPLVAILLALFVHPALLLIAPALLLAQVVRIALRTAGPDRWAYALTMVGGKFAEAQGILRYMRRKLRGGGAASAILYK